jgi:hypothetical protein
MKCSPDDVKTAVTDDGAGLLAEPPFCYRL